MKTWHLDLNYKINPKLSWESSYSAFLFMGSLGICSRADRKETEEVQNQN
jgi:hypothetical protein